MAAHDLQLSASLWRPRTSPGDSVLTIDGTIADEGGDYKEDGYIMYAVHEGDDDSARMKGHVPEWSDSVHHLTQALQACFTRAGAFSADVGAAYYATEHNDFRPEAVASAYVNGLVQCQHFEDLAVAMAEERSGSTTLPAEVATTEPSTTATTTPRARTEPPAEVRWPDLGRPASTTVDASRDAALVVAIENYAFLPAVQGAVRNGQDWYRYLTQTRKIPASRTRLLLNAESTDFNIKDAAQEVASLVQPGGSAWFVFIGHGAPNKGATDGLLVAADAQNTVQGLENRSVAQSAILGLLAKGAGTPVVVIDSCYSGKRNDGQVLVAGLQPSGVVKAPVPTGAVVMTAAASNEYAGPLPGEERPAFSYLVLGALRGWGDANSDGKVTAEEVIDYSKLTLRTLLSGNRSQTPELAGGSYTTVLGAGTERGPDLGELLLKLKSR